MAKILMQGKERFMCPVCENERIEPGQKYCQICGEALEWEEEARAERLSIDEAIIHARAVAEKKYIEGFLCYANSGNIENNKKNDGCIKCAKEHEQLAEWLEELKKYRELERKHRWIPVEERLPEDDNYILLSFSNFSLPLIGRYEADNDGGGAFYLGDDDDGDTCLSADLYVNAWQPLPEPYRPEE